MVREIVNIAMERSNVSVDKVFLIGSYAAGTPTEWSDLDFLVQLKGGRMYPTWLQIQEIHEKLDSTRTHVIFGTEEAQESLSKRLGLPYKQISFEGVTDVTSTHRPVA